MAGNGRIRVTGSVESFVRETVAHGSSLNLSLRRLPPLLSNFRPTFPKKILPTGSIAATAIVEGAPLVTADERMR
jgi:hypothetical protein